MTQRKKVVRTPGQWRRLVTEFEAGEQGPKEFCRKRRLSSTQLYKWRRRFRDGEAAAGNGPAGPPLVDFVKLPPVSPKAAPAPAAAGDGDWRVELDLGGGMVLRLRWRGCSFRKTVCGFGCTPGPRT